MIYEAATQLVTRRASIPIAFTWTATEENSVIGLTCPMLRASPVLSLVRHPRSPGTIAISVFSTHGGSPLLVVERPGTST